MAGSPGHGPWSSRQALHRLHLRPTRRAINWEIDDPFGNMDGDFLGGGGVGRTFRRPLDPAVGRTGTWTCGSGTRIRTTRPFTIVVDHPETVQTLHETRIPFQLINRVFTQSTADDPPTHEDRQRSGPYSSSTRRSATLPAIEDQNISVSGRLRDINLSDFTVKIKSYEASIPAITIGLDLEDQRFAEIGLPGPDIDLENLASRSVGSCSGSATPSTTSSSRRRAGRTTRSSATSVTCSRSST